MPLWLTGDQKRAWNHHTWWTESAIVKGNASCNLKAWFFFKYKYQSKYVHAYMAMVDPNDCFKCNLSWQVNKKCDKCGHDEATFYTRQVLEFIMHNCSIQSLFSWGPNLYRFPFLCFSNHRWDQRMKGRLLSTLAPAVAINFRRIKLEESCRAHPFCFYKTLGKRGRLCKALSSTLIPFINERHQGDY